MFRLSVLALAFVALTACGKLDPQNQVTSLDTNQFPNVSGSLYGKWRSAATTDSQGISHSLNLYFNSSQQMGYEEVCGTFGSSISVSRVVPAHFAGNQIQVSTDLQLSTPTPTGSACTLVIRSGTFTFQVNGDQLSVVDGSGLALSLQRMQP